MSTKKEYKNIVVVVKVIDVKTDKMESEVIRNIDSPDRRAWLEKHLIKTCMWAMFNGKYIEIINKEDDRE